MLALFPKCRAGLILGGAFTLLFASALAHDGADPRLIACVALFGLGGSWLLAELSAVAQHQRLLLVLYGKLRPEEFVSRYEPLLRAGRPRARIRLTVLAYLSKGYEAAGDFDNAERLLDEAAESPAASGRDAARLLAENRCVVSLARGDAVRAGKHFKLLEGMAEGMPPGRKRRAAEDSLFLLRTRLSLTEGPGSYADAEFLRNRLARNGSALHRAELEFWLARSCLLLERREEATRLLERIAAIGDGLWISRRASELLGARPKAG